MYSRPRLESLSLPAACGILSVFQFVPALRHVSSNYGTYLAYVTPSLTCQVDHLQRYPRIHRISGRTAFALLYISMIGAVMIAPHAIGGALALQSFVGALCVMSGFAVYQSWSSIRRRHVVAHREWSLRAMFYIGSAITARVIMLSTALVVTRLATHHTVSPVPYDATGSFISSRGSTDLSMR